jgi:hypothetical protein
MGLAKILSALTSDKPAKDQGVVSISLQVIAPWLTVLLVAAAIAVAIRFTKARSLAVGLGVLIVLGACSIYIPETVVTTINDKVCVSGPDNPDCRHTRRQVPAGGAEAARYVRDHSSVSDRLATNSHCMPVYADTKTCDARNFWLSAYAERRVLVEGWAYTPTGQSRKNANTGPFWDRQLLAANDKAFHNPTQADLDYLWTRYGVRWLVFDTMVSRPSAELKSLWRYRSGTVEVYQLTPPSSS